MLTAPGSLRAGTNRIGAGRPFVAAAAARRPKASRIGMLWIEITPKAARTPLASRNAATSSPTVMRGLRSGMAGMSP